jgi:hypothetical protein
MGSGFFLPRAEYDAPIALDGSSGSVHDTESVPSIAGLILLASVPAPHRPRRQSTSISSKDKIYRSLRFIPRAAQNFRLQAFLYLNEFEPPGVIGHNIGARDLLNHDAISRHQPQRRFKLGDPADRYQVGPSGAILPQSGIKNGARRA